MKTLLTPVKSSNVAATGYDAASQTLHVQFKGGKTYAYAGVPPEVNASLGQADSVGRFIGANIVGKYKHTTS
jgi:hypothetical protein